MRFALPIGLLLVAGAAMAQPEAVSDCNQSAGAIAFVDVPGHPFAAVASVDGCAIFVSLFNELAGTLNGIAVFRRANGTLSFDRMLQDNDVPYGMAVTHDGKLLVVANNSNIVFLDIARTLAKDADAIAGYISEPGAANPTSISVTLTADDAILFVADETAEGITVIDLAAARRTNFSGNSVIGRIPAGFAPIAMALSPDERLLYATIQQAPDSEGWPAACKPEGQNSATATVEDPQGAVVVIDAARAKTDPEHSVIARIPAGCAPVRLARSPSGDTLYVTARGDDALLVFDTAKLIADPDHARVVKVPVGTAPVGVAVIDEGHKIVVANSDRFSLGTAGREGLSIIDAAKAASGAPALVGTVRSGAFPRELSVTTDGKTLLVTNSDSDQLELVDLAQLPAP